VADQERHHPTLAVGSRKRHERKPGYHVAVDDIVVPATRRLAPMPGQYAEVVSGPYPLVRPAVYRTLVRYRCQPVGPSGAPSRDPLRAASLSASVHSRQHSPVDRAMRTA
jgi:hypothetical protein